VTHAPPAAWAARELTCIAVDWSGARAGERAKIWLAEAQAGELLRLESGRSRAELAAHVITRAGELARDGTPLLVGFDFSFSLPAWFLRELGLASARELWELVAREGETWLARCEPPFWGRAGRRRPAPDARHSPYRATESSLLPIGGIQPKSSFQIGGAGAVGTSALRGMPFLLELARAGFAIWPFDPPGARVAVEIWPRFFTGRVNKSSRPARQLLLAARLGSVPAPLLERATLSDDAFDAALSAVEISRRAAQRNLFPATNELEHLEGRVLAPAALRASFV
jgi:hypothetical protein